MSIRLFVWIRCIWIYQIFFYLVNCFWLRAILFINTIMIYWSSHWWTVISRTCLECFCYIIIRYLTISKYCYYSYALILWCLYPTAHFVLIDTHSLLLSLTDLLYRVQLAILCQISSLKHNIHNSMVCCYLHLSSYLIQKLYSILCFAFFSEHSFYILISLTFACYCLENDHQFNIFLK